jgi:hypothetical protein
MTGTNSGDAMLVFSLIDAFSVRRGDERKNGLFNSSCALLVCAFLIAARAGLIQSSGFGVATAITKVVYFFRKVKCQESPSEPQWSFSWKPYRESIFPGNVSKPRDARPTAQRKGWTSRLVRKFGTVLDFSPPHPGGGMKTTLKILGAVIIGFSALLLILRLTGFEPKDCPPTDRSLSCRVPGLWLKGESVTTPVNDWSFTDKIQQIKIQTQTPFLLPHSVTIWCAAYNGNLYVTSYRGRQWVEDIIRVPHVRLKIADQVYDRTLSVVSDPVEKAAVLKAKGKKYPEWKVPPVSTATVFRVNPG